MSTRFVRLARRKNGGLNFRPAICARSTDLIYAFSALKNNYGCHVILPSDTKRIPHAFHYYLKTGGLK